MSRDEAVRTLLAKGAVLGQSGDVRVLRESIVATTRTGRVYHPFSQCSRKTRYPTWDAAHRARKYMENPEIRVYECAYCQGFHNGNPPRG